MCKCINCVIHVHLDFIFIVFLKLFFEFEFCVCFCHKVGLLADNAGLEVVSDLVLIDRILRTGKKVHI